MWRRIHRNYLPILSGVLFVFILAVVVLEIDRQIYQDKKKEICTHNWMRICPDELIEDLTNDVEAYFRADLGLQNATQKRTQLHERLKAELRRIEGDIRRIDQETSGALAAMDDPTSRAATERRVRRRIEALRRNAQEKREQTAGLLQPLDNETSTTRARVAELLVKMDRETSRIVHADNPLVGIAVFAVEERPDSEFMRRHEVVASHVDKYARQNTFWNSLVDQRFRGVTDRSITTRDVPPRVLGTIEVHYTTPLENLAMMDDTTGKMDSIRSLTARYRWYLLGVVLFLGFLYWYILRHLILPVKVVTSRIERANGELPEILPRPHTALEAAYNDLARDALLTAVTRTLAEHMSVDRLVPPEEIVGSIPQLVAPHFGFAAVCAVELDLAAGPDEIVRWRRSARHGETDGRVPEPSHEDWLALGRRFERDWDQAILEFTAGSAARPYFAAPALADADGRRVMFLAATPRGPLTEAALRWHRETLLRLAAAVRTGLETLDLQRRLIVREKSQANISLSRSLGHDLTNVIATSKLDLDTMRRFLSLPPERQAGLSPAQRTLLDEALRGLLNNTKFLQEIINIYRSFSFVRHPEYECVSFNDLAGEVLELFQLSLSRHIRIHRAFDPGVPRGFVEPRLLKLALFNLLTNALDALRRRAIDDTQFDSTLWIATAYDVESRTVTLAVRDNGHGIRNPQGDLASPGEIKAIFQAGFTTKRRPMAEGLGLSWVRQIVGEFHGGQLHARNHPEGGAEVALDLPLHDAPPVPAPAEPPSNHQPKPSPAAEVIS